jgi:hypothetical protein
MTKASQSTRLKNQRLPSTPGWRNWQTQRTQNPPTFGSWGFDSPSRHHSKSPQDERLAGASPGIRCTSGADAADFASCMVTNEICHIEILRFMDTYVVGLAYTSVTHFSDSHGLSN